ncbi:hypothetical protein AAHE18_15G113800 [Arachis hypogaea]
MNCGVGEDNSGYGILLVNGEVSACASKIHMCLCHCHFCRTLISLASKSGSSLFVLDFPSVLIQHMLISLKRTEHFHEIEQKQFGDVAWLRNENAEKYRKSIKVSANFGVNNNKKFSNIKTSHILIET